MAGRPRRDGLDPAARHRLRRAGDPGRRRRRLLGAGGADARSAARPARAGRRAAATGAGRGGRVRPPPADRALAAGGRARRGRVDPSRHRPARPRRRGGPGVRAGRVAPGRCGRGRRDGPLRAPGRRRFRLRPGLPGPARRLAPRRRRLCRAPSAGCRAGGGRTLRPAPRAAGLRAARTRPRHHRTCGRRDAPPGPHSVRLERRDPVRDRRGRAAAAALRAQPGRRRTAAGRRDRTAGRRGRVAGLP